MKHLILSINFNCILSAPAQQGMKTNYNPMKSTRPQGYIFMGASIYFQSLMRPPEGVGRTGSYTAPGARKNREKALHIQENVW